MKLCIFDLDGTLLNSEKEIEKSSLKAIRALKKQNYMITLATGRSYEMVKKYSEKLGISLPIILCNGGMIYENDGYSKMLPLPIEGVQEIIGHAKSTDHYVHIYDRDTIYSEVKNDLIMDVEGQLIDKDDETKIKIVNKLEDIKHDVYKILIPFNSKEDKEVLLKRYKDIKGISLYPSGGALEIVHEEASKGSGVKFLSESLKIKPQDIVVFGDQENDISMFKFAHTSIAMGNCIEHLKEYATYVTSSNDEEGISHAVFKYLL